MLGPLLRWDFTMCGPVGLRDHTEYDPKRRKEKKKRNIYLYTCSIYRGECINNHVRSINNLKFTPVCVKQRNNTTLLEQLNHRCFRIS